MTIENLQKFEERLESMNNPRERRAFLHSLYSDLIGKNVSGDIASTKINSPYLLMAIDLSLEKERTCIEYGARILKRFGFAHHADKLIDSYANPHLQINHSEGYTVENRTRVLDRLMGTSERAVLFPTDVGNVVQIAIDNDGHVGFCVSDSPMTREEATNKYSLGRFPMGISGVGFGIPAARAILDGSLSNHVTYACIEDKASFDNAVGLALRKVA